MDYPVTTPNGRGRSHRKKVIIQRRARRIARYRAGLILESLCSDWSPDDLRRRYGDEGVEEIRKGLEYYARWLIATGHPDGSAQ